MKRWCLHVTKVEPLKSVLTPLITEEQMKPVPAIQKILTKKTSFIQFIIRKIRYSFEYFRPAYGTQTYMQARKMMPIKLCTAFLKRINQKTFAVFLKVCFFMCTSYIYIHAPQVCLMPEEDKRGHLPISSPGVESQTVVSYCGCWKPQRGPLHKHRVFLTVPSRQLHLLFSLTNVY